MVYVEQRNRNKAVTFKCQLDNSRKERIMPFIDFHKKVDEMGMQGYRPWLFAVQLIHSFYAISIC